MTDGSSQRNYRQVGEENSLILLTFPHADLPSPELRIPRVAAHLSSLNLSFLPSSPLSSQVPPQWPSLTEEHFGFRYPRKEDALLNKTFYKKLSRKKTKSKKYQKLKITDFFFHMELMLSQNPQNFLLSNILSSEKFSSLSSKVQSGFLGKPDTVQRNSPSASLLQASPFTVRCSFVVLKLLQTCLFIILKSLIVFIYHDLTEMPQSEEICQFYF